MALRSSRSSIITIDAPGGSDEVGTPGGGYRLQTAKRQQRKCEEKQKMRN
jgi:hypothetical protein